ncbi:hypothetical protein UFOVP250_11 [uncultured Caudovirales phage]|uniref:Uncharacterized protein n=1 Tax=uncultured Caudovirales phage TaxID=2100421 RepID=A0A6J5LFH5_9CAUD|nr:hypothetical protein UFOVP250_11 [uncultured Caudovirales phage]
MSTIKITQLQPLNQLQANTSNTIFVGVDIPSGVTGKITATTLAQGLYSNNALNVGINPNTLPNTIAQFALGGDSYIQTNLVNTNDGGSADIVVTANVGSGGTDSANFIDMGYANKNYQPGQEFNNIGTAISPLDGYLYVQGTKGSLGGNLIIGTTTSNTTLKFMVGGGTAANVVATMTSNSLVLNTQSYLTFADGTKQLTAGSSVANTIYLQGALNSANANITYLFGAINTDNAALSLASSNTVYLQGALNSANANINYLFGIQTTQNNSISLAWNTANSAIANTNGTRTAGDFVITGNLITLGVASTGLVTINAVSYSANTPAFRVSGSANGFSQPPINQGYMAQFTGFPNTSSRIIVDSFGANAYSVIAGRSARGTVLAPQPTANGDILMRVSGNGWANNFSQFGSGRIDIVATENYTDTSRGSQIQFWNTKPGTNTLFQIASFNSEFAVISGSLQPQKGFIWYPRQLVGAQTAITLDFANDAVIRATTAAGVTVSFANYTAGKVVDMWITNTAGTNQTFTHGCTALNSTVNATTYTIPGTSTIYVKYISFGTDVGNTFVSVTHA